MAKIRSVHPEICWDDRLAEVSASAERTFVRLWVHLDDEGRHLDEPRVIKGAIYPIHDDVRVADVVADLDELANAGLLIRYEVDGRRYLTTKPAAWSRMQKPRWRSDSKLPPPPDTSDIRPTPDAGTSDIRPTPSGSESAEPVRHDTTDAYVRHTSDDPPTYVRHPSAQVVDGDGDGDGDPTAAARNSKKLTVEQRRQLIAQAITILTDRHLDITPSRGDPDKHRQAVHRGKLRDHASRGHELLTADPTLTAHQLAEQLEPTGQPATLDDLVPGRTPPPPGPNFDRDAHANCPHCDQHGDRFDDNGNWLGRCEGTPAER